MVWEREGRARKMGDERRLIDGVERSEKDKERERKEQRKRKIER